MDEDGQQDGYDLPLTRAISPRRARPGHRQRRRRHNSTISTTLFTDGEADAVLAASIFHFGTYSIVQAKDFLAGRGIPMRT